MNRNLKRPFLWLELYRSPGRVVNFLFCLMKNPLLYRSAWPESSREACERFFMETLGGTQSERRRRSLFGMNRQCETHGGRKQWQLIVLLSSRR